MILSQLWHYTMVLPIPDNTVRKWQSMVNKFVMSRRTLAEDKYLALAPSGLIHDSKTGFKVPHIASVIRKQRVTRLQLLVQADQDEPPQWAILPTDRLSRCMYPYSRVANWDFMMYHPIPNNKLVQFKLLSPFWRDVWKQWAQIPMTMKTPHEPTLSQMTQMPLWLSSHPLFQVPGRDGISSLAITLQNHRDWTC
ncbi:hypothetical protein AeMF1_007142 [Aphanomyces euteiches]|nr:hypothetical protein AeMF1_007142 [Aphanomyces euteiches]